MNPKEEIIDFIQLKIDKLKTSGRIVDAIIECTFLDADDFFFVYVHSFLMIKNRRHYSCIKFDFSKKYTTNYIIRLIEFSNDRYCQDFRNGVSGQFLTATLLKIRRYAIKEYVKDCDNENR